jgi:hypothetical protein
MSRGDFDPRVLSDEDIDMGGFYPTPDDPATPPKDSPMRTGANALHRMTGGVRDKISQGQIKARIAGLWRNGETYKDICSIVNDNFDLTGSDEITPHTIGHHIKEMIGYWREKSLAHIDERQAMTLLRYDQIEQLATEAYFASMGGKRVRNYEKQIERANSKPRKDAIKKQVIEEAEELERFEKSPKLFQDGEIMETLQITAEKIKHYSRHEENPAGDPRFLAIMIEINHKRSQLWGLLNKGEQSTSDQELARLSDDDRTERIAAVIAQAKSRATGDRGNLAPATPLGGFKEGEEPAPELKADPPAPPEYPKIAVASPLTQETKQEVDIDDLDWE